MIAIPVLSMAWQTIREAKGKKEAGNENTLKENNFIHIYFCNTAYRTQHWDL